MGHAELELSLFGLEDDGLIFHPTDHVEGSPRLTPEGQFEEVILNALFQGFLEIGLDLKEPIRRTKSADALVGSPMVVVFDPEFDPISS